MAIQLPNPGLGDGQTGDNEYVMWTKVKDNFSNTTHAASRLVGTATGNVMEVGAFGLGSTSLAETTTPRASTGFFRVADSSTLIPSKMGAYGSVGITVKRHTTNYGATLWFPYSSNKYACLEVFSASTSTLHYFYTDQNTTVDPNGFIKAASPIVSLYADKIELNDEANLQPITFEKLGVGDYLIKGSTGFAQEGWYIEMPKDANGNVLVAVVYEQLENNDISVKTYAKKFDEETGDIVANTAKPRDIPSTRWIDLRLQELPQDDVQPLDTDETVATNAE